MKRNLRGVFSKGYLRSLKIISKEDKSENSKGKKRKKR